MANIKSAEKRIEVSERNRLRNKAYKSTVKTLMKKTFLAISSLNKSNVASIQQLMSITYSKIDKAIQKGIIHANNGNSKKSRLSRYLKRQEKSLLN
jgi:small subunit ribosomal protein S20